MAPLFPIWCKYLTFAVLKHFYLQYPLLVYVFYFAGETHLLPFNLNLQGIFDQIGPDGSTPTLAEAMT